MKTFWMIVAVLVGITLALVLMPRSGAGDGLTLATSDTLPSPPIEPTPGDPPVPVQVEELTEEAKESLQDRDLPQQLGSSTDRTPAVTTNQTEAAGADSSSAQSIETETTPADQPRLVEHETFGKVIASTSQPLDDGWLLYDGRFKVRGAGTEADPYEVPWEMLMSASETYQPRRGKKKLPERITMLHETHVRMTGYIAFPIMAAQQNELLTMRNMWDGCCVGLPPTAYDAVEVRLAQAVTGNERFTAFGSVEGLFKVDPYVRGNWLLGLYLMEDAKLTPSGDMRRDPSQHAGGGVGGGLPGGLP